MVAILALTFFGTMAAFIGSLAALAMSIGILWKIKPTQAVIRFFARQFGSPSVDFVSGKIREIVHEETADLRAQMYPNGGSSLADKINRLRLDVAIVREGLEDVKNRLEVMNPTKPTGEIAATPPMKQPSNLQV